MSSKVEYTSEGFKKITPEYLLGMIKIDKRNVMLHKLEQVLSNKINVMKVNPNISLYYEDEIELVKKINQSENINFTSFEDVYTKFTMKSPDKKSPTKESSIDPEHEIEQDQVVDPIQEQEVNEDEAAVNISPQNDFLSPKTLHEIIVNSSYLRSRGIVYNKKYRPEAILLKVYYVWKTEKVGEENDCYSFIDEHVKSWSKLYCFDKYHKIIPMVVKDTHRNNIRSYYLNRFYVTKCDIDECILVEPVSQLLRDFRRGILNSISSNDMQIFEDQFDKLYDEALEIKNSFLRTELYKLLTTRKIGKKFKLEVVRLVNEEL
jgi:hypothetical protein